MAINPFFNAEWYRATNEDVVLAGLVTDEQLWGHWVQFGAEEGRQPNPWFNPYYYLAANPDVSNAGVNAVGALDHYLQFGIYEGREFSATISASQFNATTYAEDNPDLVAAFDIVDVDDLTQAEKDTLLKHYLTFGYTEGRKGAGEIADTVQVDNVIVVKYFGEEGTVMNDKFMVETPFGAQLDNETIDGLGGDNSVVFTKDSTATTIGKDAVTLKNISKVVVESEVAAAAPAVVAFNATQPTEIVFGANTNAEVTAQFAKNAVAGSDDVLNVTNNSANVTELNINGIETVNLALNNSAIFAVNANEAKGSVLTFNLTGEQGGGLTFGSEDSTAVKTVVINGAELETGINATFSLDFASGNQINGISTLQVVGSATKANELDVGLGSIGTTWANDVAKTLELTGGDKKDSFTATKAIDILTGGKGNDTFTFVAGDSLVRTNGETGDKAKITALDTVTDFKKGDVVTVASAAFNIVKGTGTAIESEEEFYKFITTGTANDVFQYGSDAYILLTKGAAADLSDVELVKLAGVNVDNFDVTKAATGTLEFTA